MRACTPLNEVIAEKFNFVKKKRKKSQISSIILHNKRITTNSWLQVIRLKY